MDEKVCIESPCTKANNHNRLSFPPLPPFLDALTPLLPPIVLEIDFPRDKKTEHAAWCGEADSIYLAGACGSATFFALVLRAAKQTLLRVAHDYSDSPGEIENF